MFSWVKLIIEMFDYKIEFLVEAQEFAQMSTSMLYVNYDLIFCLDFS